MRVSMFRMMLPLIMVNSLPCIQWRETKGCDPQGHRNPSKDATCSTTITGKRSGYCECGAVTSRPIRRAHEVSCDHHPFTCEEICDTDSNVNLEVSAQYQHVTCGSTIKLVQHEYLFRLHSHDINYGTGSEQQSVTAHGSRDDPGSYWLVKEAKTESACALGSKIKCGARIRLEHVKTGKNLHSHNYRSPLSRHYEVSAFGETGEGDEGDVWRVKCDPETSMQCTSQETCNDDDATEYWNRYSLIRFEHEQMKTYLHADLTHRFDDSNCPRCPINGQLEVSAVSKPNDHSWWFAAEGIYIAPSIL